MNTLNLVVDGPPITMIRHSACSETTEDIMTDLKRGLYAI
jgi:hypothetical protein